MPPATAVTPPGHWVAPPRLPLMFGTAATNTLPGKASTNALVSVMGVALELSSRMRSVLMPLEAIWAGLKPLLIPGCSKTCSGASAGLPFVRPCWLVMAFWPMVLTNEPAFDATTNARNVQLLLAGTVAPASDTLEAPGKAVTLPPVQVVPVSLGLATARSGGRLSVSATPVSATLAVLVTVTISSVRSPTLTGEVAKVLLMLGPGTTFSVACPGVGLVTP